MAAPKYDTFKYDTLTYDCDIYSSSPTTTRTPNGEVGTKYHIAIDGTGYILANYGEFKRIKEAQPSFVDVQAQNEKGDKTLDSFWWYETFTDFKKGEGQKHLLDNERYWTSTGIDISTPKEFKLLKTTSKVQQLNQSTSAQAPAIVAGDYIYIGNTSITSTKYDCKYSSDAVTFTSVSSAVTSPMLDFEVDGTTIYAASAASVRKGTVGSNTDWTTATSTPMTKLCYHNKNLYGIDSTSFYLCATDGSASTPAKYTATGFTLTDLDAGESGHIYFVGYNNQRGVVFDYDGTNTTVYATLPTGFIPTCLYYYLAGIYVGGYYIEGSTGGQAGVYQIGADGQITKLAILDKADTTTGRQHAIRCIQGIGTKLYLGGDHLTGLYVYDLAQSGVSKNIYVTLTSAAANKVQDICWFLNKPYFSVALNSTSGGLYAEATTYVSTGNLKTSITDFGTTNIKLVNKIIINHTRLASGEQLQVDYSTDGTTWLYGAETKTVGQYKTEVPFDNLKTDRLSVKVTVRAGTSSLTTPTIYDIKIQAVPILNDLYIWSIPVQAYHKTKLISGDIDSTSVAEVCDELDDLKTNNTVVLFQDIRWHKTGRVHYVIVEDYKEITPKLEPTTDLDAIIIVKLREVK